MYLVQVGLHRPTACIDPPMAVVCEVYMDVIVTMWSEKSVANGSRRGVAENNIIREGGSQDIKELMIITIYFIAQITPGTKLHLYTNFQDDRSTDLGANPGQTDKQTLAAYYIRARR